MNEECENAVHFAESIKQLQFSSSLILGLELETKIMNMCVLNENYTNYFLNKNIGPVIDVIETYYIECMYLMNFLTKDHLENERIANHIYECAEDTLTNKVYKGSYSIIPLIQYEIEKTGGVKKECISENINHITDLEPDYSISFENQESSLQSKNTQQENNNHNKAAEIVARGREVSGIINMNKLPQISNDIGFRHESLRLRPENSHLEGTRYDSSSSSIPTLPSIRSNQNRSNGAFTRNIPVPPPIQQPSSWNETDHTPLRYEFYNWEHPSNSPSGTINNTNTFAAEILKECYENYYSGNNLCRGRLFHTKTRHIYENFERLSANGIMCFTGTPLFEAFDPDFDGKGPKLTEFESNRYIAVHALYPADNIYRTKPINKVFKFEIVRYEGYTFETIDLLDIVIYYPNGEILSFVESCVP